MRRVLLVEDEERVRSLFTQLLAARGYDVREAGNGHEAVEAAGQQPFDVLIMDVRLPKVDGLTALRQIRMMTPAIRTVLMTGYSVQADLEQLAHEPAIHCLQKPFTFDQLISAIDGLFATEPASPAGADTAAGDQTQERDS